MKDDLEQVYDDEIYPLMKQIIEICKQRKIPMFAHFQVSKDAEERCVTSNLAGFEYGGNLAKFKLLHSIATKGHSTDWDNAFAAMAVSKDQNGLPAVTVTDSRGLGSDELEAMKSAVIERHRRTSPDENSLRYRDRAGGKS